MPSLAALMKPISAHEVFEEAPRGSLRAVPRAPPAGLQLGSALIFSSPFGDGPGWVPYWAKVGPLPEEWGGRAREHVGRPLGASRGLCVSVTQLLAAASLPPSLTRLLQKRRWDSDSSRGCRSRSAERGPCGATATAAAPVPRRDPGAPSGSGGGFTAAPAASCSPPCLRIPAAPASSQGASLCLISAQGDSQKPGVQSGLRWQPRWGGVGVENIKVGPHIVPAVLQQSGVPPAVTDTSPTSQM